LNQVNIVRANDILCRGGTEERGGGQVPTGGTGLKQVDRKFPGVEVFPKCYPRKKRNSCAGGRQEHKKRE